MKSSFTRLREVVTSEVQVLVGGVSIARGQGQRQGQRRQPRLGDPSLSGTPLPRLQFVHGARARLPRRIKNERDGNSERQGNLSQEQEG